MQPASSCATSTALTTDNLHCTAAELSVNAQAARVLQHRHQQVAIQPRDQQRCQHSPNCKDPRLHG